MIGHHPRDGGRYLGLRPLAIAGVPGYLSSTIFIEDSRAHAGDERVLIQAFDEAVQKCRLA